MQALETLRVALSVHFAMEEDVMRQTQHPHAEQHTLRHKQILSDLGVLIRSSGLGRGIVLEGSRFLTRWLKHHLGSEDRELVRWMKQNPKVGVAG